MPTVLTLTPQTVTAEMLNDRGVLAGGLLPHVSLYPGVGLYPEATAVSPLDARTATGLALAALASTAETLAPRAATALTLTPR